MNHLGFPVFIAGSRCPVAGSIREYPAADLGATHPSQNAAAMLFDLGTVDIR
jgi:hypothetical protein